MNSDQHCINSTAPELIYVINIRVLIIAVSGSL